MAYCVRKRIKQHKGKSYEYFELVKTYRDPGNKAKVIQKFVAHLGKKAQVKANLERYRQEASGHYDPDRLIKKMGKELKKG